MPIDIKITGDTPFIIFFANTNFLAESTVDNATPEAQLEQLEEMFTSGEFTIDQIKQFIADRKRKL